MPLKSYLYSKHETGPRNYKEIVSMFIYIKILYLSKMNDTINKVRTQTMGKIFPT